MVILSAINTLALLVCLVGCGREQVPVACNQGFQVGENNVEVSYIAGTCTVSSSTATYTDCQTSTDSGGDLIANVTDGSGNESNLEIDACR